MQCHNCSAQLRDTAKFCAKCGSAFTGELLCPTCNKPHSGVAKFCSVDGTPLSATQQAGEMPTPHPTTPSDRQAAVTSPDRLQQQEPAQSPQRPARPAKPSYGQRNANARRTPPTPTTHSPSRKWIVALAVTTTLAGSSAAAYFYLPSEYRPSFLSRGAENANLALAEDGATDAMDLQPSAVDPAGQAPVTTEIQTTAGPDASAGRSRASGPDENPSPEPGGGVQPRVRGTRDDNSSTQTQSTSPSRAQSQSRSSNRRQSQTDSARLSTASVQKITAYLKAAELNWKMGEFANAIEECNRALEIQPNNKEALEMKVRIERSMKLLSP